MPQPAPASGGRRCPAARPCPCITTPAGCWRRPPAAICWRFALRQTEAPSAFALSRQNLPVLDPDSIPAEERAALEQQAVGPLGGPQHLGRELLALSGPIQRRRQPLARGAHELLRDGFKLAVVVGARAVLHEHLEPPRRADAAHRGRRPQRDLRSERAVDGRDDDAVKAAVRGRNNWIVWTAGNDRLWDIGGTGTLFEEGALYRGAIQDGEYWRLVTAGFLHDGLPHLLFNMLALFFFGPRVEERILSRQFAILYFLSGITGAVLSGDPDGRTLGLGLPFSRGRNPHLTHRIVLDPVLLGHACEPTSGGGRCCWEGFPVSLLPRRAPSPLPTHAAPRLRRSRVPVVRLRRARDS